MLHTLNEQLLYCCFTSQFFSSSCPRNFTDNLEAGKKNLLNQQNWRSRVANCICCRLDTNICNWMNYFTAWEQRHSIHSIKYNVQLTAYAVGHPQLPICFTQQHFFFSELSWVCCYRKGAIIHTENRTIEPLKKSSHSCVLIFHITFVTRRRFFLRLYVCNTVIVTPFPYYPLNGAGELENIV